MNSPVIAINVETQRLRNLQMAFYDMNHSDKRKIIVDGLKKATKPTVEKAKQTVHVGPTGNLRRSIGQLVPNNEAAVVVGARRNRGNKGHHGIIVEEGTVERYYLTKRGVKHRTGKMNPNGPYAHYLLRAVQSTEQDVLNTVSDEWNKAIEKFHRKNGLV